jgi:hypothetical protein
MLYIENDTASSEIYTKIHIFMLSRLIIVKIRFFWGKSFSENLNTNLVFSNSFFFSWKSFRFRDNVEKCGRARQATGDSIMRRVRTALRITKATNVHSEYVIHTAFQLQQWLREGISGCYVSTYTACLIYYPGRILLFYYPGIKCSLRRTNWLFRCNSG